MGEFEDAEQCSEQAADLARTNDRPYDLIAAGYSRGFVELMRGNLEEAELALGNASRRSHESAIRLFLPLVMWAQGNLHIQKGQAAEARDILLKAKEEAQALGHDASAVAVSAYLGIASGQLGDVPGGLAAVRACEASAKQKGYGGIEALAAFAEAVILSTPGHAAIEEAIECLGRTMEIATRLEARPLVASARGFLASLLAASGRSREAQDELNQAIALFDRSKMTMHLERAKAELSKFSDM